MKLILKRGSESRYEAPGTGLSVPKRIESKRERYVTYCAPPFLGLAVVFLVLLLPPLTNKFPTPNTQENPVLELEGGPIKEREIPPPPPEEPDLPKVVDPKVLNDYLPREEALGGQEGPMATQRDGALATVPANLSEQEGVGLQEQPLGYGGGQGDGGGGDRGRREDPNPMTREAKISPEVPSDYQPEIRDRMRTLQVYCRNSHRSNYQCDGFIYSLDDHAVRLFYGRTQYRVQGLVVIPCPRDSETMRGLLDYFIMEHRDEFGE